MSTNEPMSDERLAEACAALDEDMSQWGGEYGLELIAEVERLRALTTVDDDMVERAKRAFGAATAQVSSVPLGMSEGMFIDSVGLQHQHAIRAALEAALNPGATITINDAGTGGCTLIATGTARGRHATR